MTTQLLRFWVSCELKLPNGSVLHLHVDRAAIEDGRQPPGTLLVAAEYDVYTTTVLPGVSTSSGGDGPDVDAILSQDQPDRALLMGGPLAYLVTSDAEVITTMTWRRRWDRQAYWSTEIHTCRYGMLVVLETEVFLVDRTLNVAWHHAQAWAYDLPLTHLDDEVCEFGGDPGGAKTRVCYALSDGRRIPMT